MVNNEPLNKDTTEHIHFDKPRFERFKKVYQKTLRAKEDTFMFDGCIVLVDYAKYVIEYVEGVAKTNKW